MSCDRLLEFWDPLISWEPLKLETSNFVRIWMAVSSNEKMQNFVKTAHVGVILGPPNISGTVKRETSNLSLRWMASRFKEKM